MISDSAIPRRRWPLRYVLLFIAGWFALPVIVWLVWGWIESARLDRALDALEARNEPLDVAAFNIKPTTPEQIEASHLYAEAGKLIADRAIPTAEAARISGIIDQLCGSSSDSSPHATEVEALKAFEEPYTQAFVFLDRASALKGVGWADSDRPPRASMQELHYTTLIRANAARIARRACTGDGDGAAVALLASLRLQRMLNFPVPSTRTAHSLQLVLAARGGSPGTLREIQEEYASTTSDRALEELMLRERANWLSFVMPGVFSEPRPGSGPHRITPAEAIATRLARPLRDHRWVAEISEFDEAIAVAKQPWPATFDAVNAFAKARPTIRSQSMPRGLLETLTRPFGGHMATNALTNYVNGIAEALARARSSVGAVAVARYQRDHGGAIPGALQQLMPNYLTPPLIDPYSGGELKFSKNGNGYKIYSVGANRKDDAGEWEQQPDLQFFRRGNPLDVGIAVGMLRQTDEGSREQTASRD